MRSLGAEVAGRRGDGAKASGVKAELIKKAIKTKTFFMVIPNKILFWATFFYL
jgi:hypothetical protein